MKLISKDCTRVFLIVLTHFSLEMQYLDEIAERFYNVPRRDGMQGMLGDFMKV